jgi:hypothetical protein
VGAALRGSCSKKCVRPNIFTDAFGNAVGESLAQQFRTSQNTLPRLATAANSIPPTENQQFGLAFGRGPLNAEAADQFKSEIDDYVANLPRIADLNGDGRGTFINEKGTVTTIGANNAVAVREFRKGDPSGYFDSDAIPPGATNLSRIVLTNPDGSDYGGYSYKLNGKVINTTITNPLSNVTQPPSGVAQSYDILDPANQEPSPPPFISSFEALTNRIFNSPFPQGPQLVARDIEAERQAIVQQQRNVAKLETSVLGIFGIGGAIEIARGADSDSITASNGLGAALFGVVSARGSVLSSRPIAVAPRVGPSSSTLPGTNAQSVNGAFSARQAYTSNSQANLPRFNETNSIISRGAALRLKYSNLTPQQRTERLNQLAEENAFRRLKEIEDLNPGAHFIEKHGVKTTLQSQLERVQFGRNPTTGVIETQKNGSPKIPPSATRFFSNRDQLNAIYRAQNIYNLTGDPVLAQRPFKFDYIIGEGFQKGSLDYGTSYSARVFFNKNGQPTTAFPIFGK